MRSALGRSLAAFASAVALFVWTPAPASAQGDDCEFLAPSGNYVRRGGVTHVSTPNLRCNDGSRIRADSVVFFEVQERYQFFGNVRFDDPERLLVAQQVDYYRLEGSITARNDVELTRKTDGALVTGEYLYYLQERPGRPRDQLTVTGGRPHAILVVQPDTTRPITDPTTLLPDSLQPDTAGAPPPVTGDPPMIQPPPLDPGGGQVAPVRTEPITYDVYAETIELEGERFMRARIQVEILRDSLRAFSQFAVYDGEAGRLQLDVNARIEDPDFTLEADTIEVSMPGEVIDRVTARRRAVLTGQDLEMRGPEIRMFMSGEALDRLVVVRDSAAVNADRRAEDELSGAALPQAEVDPLTLEHPSRPIAKAQDFQMVADSLDVLMTGERLDRLFAVGNARGQSAARDSINPPDIPPILARDWMEGETIEALFAIDSAASADPETESEPTLEALVARVRARSFYRLRAQDSAAAAGPPSQDSVEVEPRRSQLAYHFVLGDTITLFMDSGEVSEMDVVGQVRGIHWEPTVGSRPGTGRGGSGGNPPGGESPRRAPTSRPRRRRCASRPTGPDR